MNVSPNSWMWVLPCIAVVGLATCGSLTRPSSSESFDLTAQSITKENVVVPANGATVTVVAMTSATCPLSKKYWPRLVEMEQEFAKKSVAFVYVNPYPTETSAQISAMIGKSIAPRYVHGEALAAKLGARTTGEVFVINQDGTVAYRGAVDDQYGLTFTKKKPEKMYLRDAIESTLKGEAPKTKKTEPAGCALELVAQATPTTVTFHNQISRILQKNCQSCHNDGGIAPFALSKYNEVAMRAPMIRNVVRQGIMPPWGAAPEPNGAKSPWKHDRSLSKADKEALISWADNGKPEGNPKDAPAPITFPKGWQMGKPDAIFQIPKPIDVQADGYMEYQFVVVPTNLTEDKWVDRIEIAPTDRSVVHHVLVWPISKADMERGRTRPSLAEQAGFFGGYVPGTSLLSYEMGFGKKIPAGAGLLFQIHYTPNGKATKDQVRLGVRFCKEKPTHEVMTTALANLAINIPPGAANHVETSQIKVPINVTAMSFMPHMHVRGKAFKYEMTLADGTQKTLLDIPRYDFNWQLRYEFAEPLTIPRGATLKATAVYDNSDANPANPDSSKRVRWGDQTYEEMFLGYIEFYIPVAGS